MHQMISTELCRQMVASQTPRCEGSPVPTCLLALNVAVCPSSNYSFQNTLTGRHQSSQQLFIREWLSGSITALVA